MTTRVAGLACAAVLMLAGCAGTDPSPTPGPQISGGGNPMGSSGSPGGAAAPVLPGAGDGSGGAAQNTGGAGQNPGGGAPSTAGANPGGGEPGAGGTDPGNSDPQAPRPIKVEGSDNTNLSFNGQQLSLNKSKLPIQGKLVLLLGGICTGTGAGGFESFVKQYGFHVFAPKTDTCLTGGSVPQQYKDAAKANPNDVEANRQVSDARMELWDGKDRVDWYSHSAAESIQQETIDALEYAQDQDPGGDWTWFLNADGTLRTSDVIVVGYSWGSQSWAMISSFVRFSRVICTSGPVSEGFPNGGWITAPGPNATPGDRKYILVDLKQAYPSPGEGNMEKFENVIKAGWDDDVTSVMPTGTGTYTDTQHLFAMIGSNNASPGGHTVFCNDNPQNGWLPLCKHVLGVQ